MRDHSGVFFTRRLYDAQLAVDVVAETYARAIDLRRRFRGNPTDAEALAAWSSESVATSYNETLRRGAAERRDLRRVGVVAPALDAEELARIEDLAALRDLRDMIAAALASSRRSSERWYSCASWTS